MCLYLRKITLGDVTVCTKMSSDSLSLRQPGGLLMPDPVAAPGVLFLALTEISLLYLGLTLAMKIKNSLLDKTNLLLEGKLVQIHKYI